MDNKGIAKLQVETEKLQRNWRVTTLLMNGCFQGVSVSLVVVQCAFEIKALCGFVAEEGKGRTHDLTPKRRDIADLAQRTQMLSVRRINHKKARCGQTLSLAV